MAPGNSRRLVLNNTKTIEIFEGRLSLYQADALFVPIDKDFAPDSHKNPIYQNLCEDSCHCLLEEIKMTANGRFDKLSGAPDGSAHLLDLGEGWLTAKYIILTVPIDYCSHSVSGPFTQIRSCCTRSAFDISVKNALILAEGKGIASIGIPALITEPYKLPLKDCVEVVWEKAINHLRGSLNVKRVGLVLPDTGSYKEAEAIVFPSVKERIKAYKY